MRHQWRCRDGGRVSRRVCQAHVAALPLAAVVLVRVRHHVGVGQYARSAGADRPAGRQVCGCSSGAASSHQSATLVLFE